MSNRWCFEDYGQDIEDKTTDEELLKLALNRYGNFHEGYYVQTEGSDWEEPRTVLAPGMTELKVKQRRQRTFLLLCLFQPQTPQDVTSRERALRRFVAERDDDPAPIRLELTITQTKRGPVR